MFGPFELGDIRNDAIKNKQGLWNLLRTQPWKWDEKVNEHVINKTGSGDATSLYFSQVDFSGLLFKLIDFSGTNFEECNFDGATFKNCTFNNVDFQSSSTTDARFIECSLSGTEFRGPFPKQLLFEKSDITYCTYIFQGGSERNIDSDQSSISFDKCSLNENTFGLVENIKFSNSIINTLFSTSSLSRDLGKNHLAEVNGGCLYSPFFRNCTIKGDFDSNRLVNPRFINTDISMANIEPGNHHKIPESMLKTCKYYSFQRNQEEMKQSQNSDETSKVEKTPSRHFIEKAVLSLKDLPVNNHSDIIKAGRIFIDLAYANEIDSDNQLNISKASRIALSKIIEEGNSYKIAKGLEKIVKESNMAQLSGNESAAFFDQITNTMTKIQALTNTSSNSTSKNDDSGMMESGGYSLDD